MENDKLVRFLYTLLRDHLPAGVVEKIMVEQVEKASELKAVYSNSYLEGYARELAKRLIGHEGKESSRLPVTEE